MQPMALFASLQYSFLPVANGSLEGSSSSVIPQNPMLSLWCVFIRVIRVNAASYQGPQTYAGDLNMHRMPENERGGWVALKE
jgi:hypothetical protein